MKPIHLTTAFQLAGYPHVVGTLWERPTTPLPFASSTPSMRLLCRPRHRRRRDRHQGCRAGAPPGRARPPWRPARDAPSLWAAYLHAGAW